MLEYFSLFYYTVPIQIIVTFLFVLHGILFYKKIKEFKILILYGIISLLQCGFGVYISVFTDHDFSKNIIIRNSINIFMLFEYIVFYYFIINSIKSAKIKKVLRFFAAGYPLLVFYYWIYTPAFNEIPDYLTVIESYLIIIGCLFYYLEIFTTPANIKLLEHPQFWTITGMLLLFAFLIPLFLQRNNILLNFIDLYNTIYVMNFIGYITLFIFFNIGLRCQIKISA